MLTDVRTSIFNYQIEGVKSYYSINNSEIKISRIDTRIIDFNYPGSGDSTDKVWTYKVPFGFFFLIGLLGLIIVESYRKYFLVLITAHLIVLLLASLVFYLSINMNTWLLAINDLLTRYFTPMISIGVVAFALIDKRK